MFTHITFPHRSLRHRRFYAQQFSHRRFYTQAALTQRGFASPSWSPTFRIPPLKFSIVCIVVIFLISNVFQFLVILKLPCAQYFLFGWENIWYIQPLAFVPREFSLHGCPRKLLPSQGLAVVVMLNTGISAAQIAGELSKQVLEMTFESDEPWAMDYEIEFTGHH